MPCALPAQGIAYRVTVVTSGAPAFRVRAEFPVPAGRDTFLVSLPAWSPGSYEIMNYARYVHGFTATDGDGRALFWDKRDPDTWRIATGGARRVVVAFETDPDSVALELSRIDPGFAYFNGTNLFPYPDGAGYDFPSQVTLDVPAGWRIATGLTPAGAPGRYRAASYHDLVDSPTFLGHFAFDSVAVDGRPVRFAMYPASALTPALWDSVSDALRRIAATEDRIMGGPVDSGYTVLVYAPDDLDWAGGLEHRNAQLDVIQLAFFSPDPASGVLGSFTRPLFAHEFFHLWNVKRIRPAAMWPYDYAHEQPTPLLWWSEGVTDYYADLALARSRLWTAAQFVDAMSSDAQQVEAAPEIVSAEDASIDTWITPTYVDEAQYYYPKGALLGFMLDLEIRQATGGRHSLDDVMRSLLDGFWRRGRGFTTADLLGLIRPWYPGIDGFYGRYVRGRQPLPYDSILPLAGLTFDRRERRVPVIGVGLARPGSGGTPVTAVVPGSLAEAVGLAPGDTLLSLGAVDATGPEWPLDFVQRYADSAGQTIRVAYLHDGRKVVRSGPVQIRTIHGVAIRRDQGAPDAARDRLARLLAP